MHAFDRSLANRSGGSYVTQLGGHITFSEFGVSSARSASCLITFRPSMRTIEGSEGRYGGEGMYVEAPADRVVFESI